MKLDYETIKELDAYKIYESLSSNIQSIIRCKSKQASLTDIERKN